MPERIRSITKQRLVEVGRAMFAEDTWGLGVLGNCGEEFVGQLEKQLAPLWKEIAPEFGGAGASTGDTVRGAVGDGRAD